MLGPWCPVRVTSFCPIDVVKWEIWVFGHKCFSQSSTSTHNYLWRSLRNRDIIWDLIEITFLQFLDSISLHLEIIQQLTKLPSKLLCNCFPIHLRPFCYICHFNLIVEHRSYILKISPTLQSQYRFSNLPAIPMVARTMLSLFSPTKWVMTSSTLS